MAAEHGEMRVAGDEERSGVTRGQREEEVVLHSRQPENLVVRKDAREQAPSFKPARPSGGRLEGDQAAHQSHHAPRTATGDAA